MQKSLNEALVKAVNDVPHLKAEFSSDRLRLHHNGDQVVLSVEYKQRASPKEIRELLYRVHDSNRTTIIAAPSLSKESRKLLRRAQVGYWDAGGSLYLKLPWGVYFVEKDPPPQPRGAREPKHPYRGRTAQVLHALLLCPQARWGVSELAEAADVSTFTAHQTLKYLEEQLWVEKIGRGPQTTRRLVQPGKLLDAWAAQHDTLRSYTLYRFHRLVQNHAAQESALFGLLEQASICKEWVLTLEHGVQRVSPFVHTLPKTIAVVVPEQEDWERLAGAAGFRPVEDGHNFLFLACKDRSPFLGRKRVGNAWIPSPIQLYLDLFGWPRRGREQARQLRAKTLDF